MDGGVVGKFLFCTCLQREKIIACTFLGKERDHIWTRNGSLKSGVNTEKMKGF